MEKKTKPTENFNVQKRCEEIHFQYGTTEMANYRLQQMCDKIAQDAFNAGRESIIENLPELEWTETTYNLEDYFLSHNNGWNYSIFFRGGAFKVCCNSDFIGQFLSLTAAKQAANEDYKKRIKQALGL